MTFKLFEPSEDSLLGIRRAAMSRMGRTHSWLFPWLMLVWSIWIFITPLYESNYFKHWLWPTLTSYAVFLVLFYWANYRDRRHVIWCALGMGVIGFATTPYNPGAQGYMIFACAFLAYALRPRLALLSMVVLLALYSLEWLLLGWSALYLISAVVVGFAVGLMNLAQAQKDKADAALGLSHEEVRRLASLAERERIGRDLHDLLGHTLSLVALKSELAGKLLQRGDSLEARIAAQREIADVSRVAREALAQVRTAVTGIRAAGIAAELVSAKLLLECDGIRFASEVDPCWLEGGALPGAVETALAMTVREGITNIQRHAKATEARVELETIGGEAVLRIVDNGRGGAIVPGNGLAGMRERIEALGGRLRIDSSKDAGTKIEVRVPLLAGDAAETAMAVNA